MVNQSSLVKSRFDFPPRRGTRSTLCATTLRLRSGVINSSTLSTCQLKLHLLRILHIYRSMISVQVNDYCYSYRCFRSGNRYNKQGKENTIQFIGVQVFVESHEIDVHAV